MSLHPLFLFLSLLLPSLVLLSFPTSLPSVSSAASTVDLTLPQQQTFLDLHNWARAAVVPPAADMAALSWDFGLSGDAFSVAAQAAGDSTYQSNNNIVVMRLTGVSGTTIGQLYSSYIPVAFSSVLTTYGPPAYDFQTNTCNGTSASGCHPYTQVISNTNRVVGCSANEAASGGVSAYVFVCIYDSTHNDGFAPYTAGQTCSLCPGSLPFCHAPTGQNGGLTATSGLCTNINGILAVGANPPAPNYFTRRSTTIMMYVEIGLGFLTMCALIYYAYLVRGWYLSGETKTIESTENSGKYAKIETTEGGANTTGSGNLLRSGGQSSSVIAVPTKSGAGMVGLAGAKPPPLPAGAAALPPNWQIHKDGQGRQYYYNTVTGASQWTLPK